GRGHAAAAHPTAPLAVAFARRPGAFALVIDCAEGRETHRLQAPEGRHFYGHGVFLDGGRLLVTTENDIASGAGRLGIWDLEDGFIRLDEVPSGGIGPHEVVRLPGDILAVANGGIRTHPATGRDKLNLETMRPNLAYLQDGALIDMVEPAQHHLSIRHLAARTDGTVAMAIQWQGDPDADVPLLAIHRRGAAMEMRGADLARDMRGYAGSVAWSGSGNTVAITGPRGGLAAIWEGGDLRLLRRPDICGVAPTAEGLAFTDGLGGVLTDLGTRRHMVAWDNHLVPLGFDPTQQ
ncbi:MAG: DUF1513 domain-containing protein, partial [Jannaschia sp.]